MHFEKRSYRKYVFTINNTIISYRIKTSNYTFDRVAIQV